MAAKYESEHEMKWRYTDMALNQIGFWVRWQRDFIIDDYKYAIGLRGEKQPMGIYEGEATAQAMVKLLLSNARDEKES